MNVAIKDGAVLLVYCTVFRVGIIIEVVGKLHTLFFIMTIYTPTDITLLIGAVSTALGSLFLVIQRSRCTTVKCCGMQCDRQVADEADPESLDTLAISDIESQLDRVTHASLSPTRNSVPAHGSVSKLVAQLEQK